MTARLNQDNLASEIKGLEAVGDRVGQGKALILVNSVQGDLETPEWVWVVPVVDWLLL